MSIEHLIELFKGNHNGSPELEIRFIDTTFEEFKTIYDEFAKVSDPTFECSVFIIDDIDKNERDRREIYYTNGVLSEDKLIKKKRLHKNIIVPNDYMKYVIGLSLEIPITTIATKATNTVRFKSRTSFNVEYNGLKWRLDLTAVKSGVLKNLEKLLPSIRDKICGVNNKKSTYIDNINKISTIFDTYEVELEYNDDPAKIGANDMSVATLILKTLNPNYEQTSAKQDTIYKIASYIYSGDHLAKFMTSGMRDLVPQVKTLDKRLYNQIYPMTDYYLTEKTDGVRNIIMVNENILYILNSNDLKKIQIHSMDKSSIIVEAELYNNIYSVFDVILIKTVPSRDGTTNLDQLIANEPFSTRIQHIPEAVEYLNNINELLNKDDNKIKFSFIAKTYEKLNQDTLQKQISMRYNAEYKSPIDGLIFVEPSSAYVDTVTYKWKSYEHNTIDFLAIRLPDNMRGIYPYVPDVSNTMYILFVSILHHDRSKIGLGLMNEYSRLIPSANSMKYPVQFSPSINPIAYIYQTPDTTLSGKIIELTRNADNTDWLFVRHRDDRLGEKTYYGNAFSTAERTFMNFYDRFELEYLWNPKKGYFKERQGSTDSQYFANKCKRIIIATIFKKYISGADKVIDLAIGRGGDLPRYRALGIKELLGIERDASAVSELIISKYRVLERTKYGGNMSECEEEYRRIQSIEYNKLIKHDVKSLTIHTIIADLTTPYCAISAQCGRFGFHQQTADAIVCNFAFHYMCDSVKNVKNVLSLAIKQIKDDGYFIITTLNGERVFDLLKNKTSWEYNENGATKYKIEKRFKSGELTNTGQQIATLLPMSNEMMEEPLCNISYVINEASKLKFECVESKSFGDYRQLMPVSNITEALNDDDWFYIGLYHILVFKCVAPTRKFA